METGLWERKELGGDAERIRQQGGRGLEQETSLEETRQGVSRAGTG